MTQADGSAVVTGRDAGCAFDHVSGRTFHGRRGGRGKRVFLWR